MLNEIAHNEMDLVERPDQYVRVGRTRFGIFGCLLDAHQLSIAVDQVHESHHRPTRDGDHVFAPLDAPLSEMNVREVQQVPQID